MVTSYSAGNCKKFYNFAYKFLLNILPIEISEKELNEKYFNPKLHNFKTIENLFERMIVSAQNYQRMPNVINFEKRKEQIVYVEE